jgi:hypothetical protein
VIEDVDIAVRASMCLAVRAGLWRGLQPMCILTSGWLCGSLLATVATWRVATHVWSKSDLLCHALVVQPG